VSRGLHFCFGSTNTHPHPENIKITPRFERGHAFTQYFLVYFLPIGIESTDWMDAEPGFEGTFPEEGGGDVFGGVLPAFGFFGGSF
jgi:hypothetical protein